MGNLAVWGERIGSGAEGGVFLGRGLEGCVVESGQEGGGAMMGMQHDRSIGRVSMEWC